MLKEFESGQAVVIDGDGKVLWQLERPEKTVTGKWKFRHILSFPTKREAENKAKGLGFPAASVCKYPGRLGFIGYAIQWDPRWPYYLACWE
jgi:hypothetical protein